MAKLPLVAVEGSPEEVGRAHGRQARDRIVANLALYFRRFQEEWGVSRDAALERAGRYEASVRQAEPAYWEALEGVAHGARLPLEEVLALNLRYEIVYSEYSRRGQAEGAGAGPGGCTSLAVLPEATREGRLLLAQNWDWIPGVAGLVLRFRVAGGPAVLAFTEAGIVGPKIGLNDAGLGLLINGLVSDRDDWQRLGIPFHVRCWRVLQSRTLQEAARPLADARGSCSANFLLGQARDGTAQVLDLETSPVGTEVLRPRDGVLTHANHFHRGDALGIWEPLQEERTSTFERQRRIDALLEGARTRGERVDRERVMAYLRDHDEAPRSLCRHPEAHLPEVQRYQTVVSAVLEPGEGRLWLAAGPPCETPYEEYRLRPEPHSRTR